MKNPLKFFESEKPNDSPAQAEENGTPASMEALPTEPSIQVEKLKVDDSKCNKCKGILDTDGYPLWCKACRATYKREYNATLSNRDRAVGFHQGIDADRDMLGLEFARLGRAVFNGAQVVFIICQSPRPEFRMPEHGKTSEAS